MRDSLACLGLDLTATEREAKVRFRHLSRQFHPDKHQPNETGLTEDQAKAKFQEFNNAYAYLRDKL
jgi:DnaJ-class molecular chaperone